MIDINYIKIRSILNGVVIENFYNLTKTSSCDILLLYNNKYLIFTNQFASDKLYEERAARPKEADLRRYMLRYRI